MTVERGYPIAIVTLGDWLANLPPLFQPKRTKTNRTLYAQFFFSRVLSKLQVISWNSDWVIALFALVVIGRSNYFGIEFSIVI